MPRVPEPPQPDVPGWVYGLLGVAILIMVALGCSGHLPGK